MLNTDVCASALRLRAAARLQLGDADGARQDLTESVEIARGADALYEVALALDPEQRSTATPIWPQRARSSVGSWGSSG